MEIEPWVMKSIEELEGISLGELIVEIAIVTRRIDQIEGEVTDEYIRLVNYRQFIAGFYTGILMKMIRRMVSGR